MNPTTLIIIIVLILIVIIAIWYISILNKLNINLVKIDEAKAGIDIALTKRYDLLTKMIEVVKSYAKHEKETLFEVVKLRNNMSIDEKIKENSKMDYNFDQIKIIAENYPKLKSSENYKTLQLAITDVEEHLQVARKTYNSNVSIYNQNIVTFPNSIVATSRKMKKQPFFEIEEHKRKDVKIDL